MSAFPVCWVVLGGVAVGALMETPGAATSEPAGVLAAPRDAESEQAWLLRVVETGDELVRRAETAGDPLPEIDARLRAANWIMSYGLEPIASRRLLDIPLPGDPAEAERHLARIQGQLDRAAQLGRELVERGDTGSERAETHLSHLETLRAFAAALQAIWPETAQNKEACEQAAMAAASGLAVVLEDDRPEVSDAAMLWQGYLYGQAGRLDRALDVMAPALSDRRDRSTYNCLAALRRCRQVASAGKGYSAAIALLLRLEDRSSSWLEGADKRAQVKTTIVWFRRAVLADWATTLAEAGEVDRAEWCREAISRLDGQHFSGQRSAELLRLGMAVPAVVALELAPVAAPIREPVDEAYPAESAPAP